MNHLKIIFYIKENHLAMFRLFSNHIKEGRIYAEVEIGKHLVRHKDGFILKNSLFPIYKKVPIDICPKCSILNISKLQIKFYDSITWSEKSV